MSKVKMSARTVLLYLCLTSLMGCGGPRINTQPKPVIDHGDLSTIENQHLQLSLQKLLVKNRPGSWAKDANWDEYILAVKPITAMDEIIVQGVYIVDVMGDHHSHENSRKALNKSTKAVKKKYKKAGYKVKIGAGSTHASVVGVSMALGSGAAAGAVTASGSIGALTSVGVGVAVAVPALVISGVTKIVFNTRVNNRIQERQTLPPIKISADVQEIDLLFPAVPLPQALVMKYDFNGLPQQISIDLTQVTSGLHIKKK